MRTARVTFDPIGIIVAVIAAAVPINSLVRAAFVTLGAFCLCHWVCHRRPVATWPRELQIFLCLFLLWVALFLSWQPINDQYRKEQRTAIVNPSPTLPPVASTPSDSSEPLEPRRKEEKVQDKKTDKPQTPEKTKPALAIDFVQDPRTLVPQTDQPSPAKVTRFAKIRVVNLGSKTVENVRVTLIRFGEMDGRWQLLPSSLLTLFRLPNPSRTPESVRLNPGDDQYFDALVECNGTECPKGVLAVPYVSDGGRYYAVRLERYLPTRPDELTFRASGEGVSAVTRTFRVTDGPQGEFVLEAKPE
jgi:hypothetical protein